VTPPAGVVGGYEVLAGLLALSAAGGGGGGALAEALAVGLGGAVGAVARFAVDDAVGGRRGTVVVNVLGSAALGGLVAAPLPASTLLVAGTGFCGAFTTFSSLAVTVETLARRDGWARAAAYGGGTLVAALAGVGVGAWLATLATQV
jgi:CrcB protein